ncbi:MAG: hypothetical protein K5864_04335 [Bacteroidales bacterium]|nr:hypothetical protein [Bacteroidales bacterium]
MKTGNKKNKRVDKEPQLTDNDLILRYREGDANSFMVLLERYECKVFGYIYSMVKDNEIANEIFEHTFYKFIIKLRREQYNLKLKNEFSSWVMRIAHDLIVSYFRYKKAISPNDGQKDKHYRERKRLRE